MENSTVVTVGKVLSVHGTSGGVRVEVLSDVSDRFNTGKVVQVSSTSYRISGSKPIRTGQIILNLQGLHTREAAHLLVGSWITVPITEAPQLSSGEFFYFQLLGLQVVTDEGEELGHLTDIMETGSNDVYVVTGQGRELLIPALADVVKEIKLDQGVMVVHLLDGLR